MEVNEKKTNSKKLTWLWILIASLVVAGIAAWCIVCAILNPKSAVDALGNTVVLKDGVENVLNFGSTFVLFAIAFIVLGLGYLLGGINIKGI